MGLADRINAVRTPLVSTGTAVDPGHRRGPSHRVADPFADVKASVHEALLENLGPRLYDPRMDQAELEQQVRMQLQTVLELEETPLSSTDRSQITQDIADDILGHGPLEPLLRDPDITEIMVNGPDSIYVERAGQIHPVAARFSSDAHLRRTIDKIVGRVGPAGRRGQPHGRRPAA